MTADPGNAGIDDLERRWGPAADPANPLGHRAVLAADEAGEPLAAGERMLDEYGLNAEFVPESLGGRLRQVDRFAVRLRSVFRRDPVLGLGYGAASFIGAVPVWTSGSADQRRWLADLLLAGQRVSAGYTELAHGGDFSRASLRARPDAGGFRVSGGKQLISNVQRARAVTVFARTADDHGSRSHSHLLLDLSSLPPDRVHRSARYRTSGMRALRLGGIDFLDCPVPPGSLVGELGGGLETVLRAFQVTRCVLPGMGVGVLDAQLRSVTRFARERMLYGRAVADLPLTRSVLVDAFLDLLACECLSLVAARALHVLPGQSSVHASAVKYLVPHLLLEADARLGTLLGARSYLREGPLGSFQKNSRDLAVAMLAHASSATCLASLVPQLPRMARRSWLRADPPPAALFRLGGALPEIDLDRLTLSAGGVDELTAVPGSLLAEPGRLADEPRVAGLCAFLVEELTALRKACDELAPRDRTVAAGPAAFDLAERYALVLAAGACIGVWWHNRDGADPFLAEPTWLVGVLQRLAERLGAAPGPADRRDVEERLYGELCDRLDDDRALDFSSGRLAG